MNTPEHIIEVDGTQRELFFLRGHMKSGTNWAGGILNLHPEIRCEGEYHFNLLMEPLTAHAHRPWLPVTDPHVRACVEQGHRSIIRSCLSRLAEGRPDAVMLGDRTPIALSEMLSGAKIVRIVRDGRDVLVSAMFHMLRRDIPHADDEVNRDLDRWRQVFGKNPEYFNDRPGDLFFSESLVREFAQSWCDHAVADHRFIERCRSGELSTAVHSFTYESLHADVEGVRAGIYRFLGRDPSLAQAVETNLTTVPGFGDRGDRPLGFHRAGRVGEWKKYFTPNVKHLFEEIAGDALRLSGYERSDAWVTRQEQPAA